MWDCQSHSPWVMGSCLYKQLKIWTQLSPQNLFGVPLGVPNLMVQRSGTARLPGRNAGTATVLPAALEHGSGLRDAASRQIPSSPFFLSIWVGCATFYCCLHPASPCRASSTWIIMQVRKAAHAAGCSSHSSSPCPCVSPLRGRCLARSCDLLSTSQFPSSPFPGEAGLSAQRRWETSWQAGAGSSGHSHSTLELNI